MSSKIKPGRIVFQVLLGGVLALAAWGGMQIYHAYIYKNKILELMISRLEADSRIAEVLVTEVVFNPMTQKHMTTLKFLEYDALHQPMAPKYFTFTGNIIQFQSLVVRFDDIYVKQGDPLKGKSAYLFWKVFMLDGKNTEEYIVTPLHGIPEGYKIPGGENEFEQKLWREFWTFALDSKKAISQGIKNAQIEAPGTKFVPGILYTLKIEHDGGIRIDTQPIPAVLRGEKL
ncbi:MAG TPA: hypothetical protein PLT76_04915 [Candidatus Omnitrophota bacterium]|nr:hypothetical protein [Candidatus Omnitrophota bacterium]HPB67390.1 hypothetical protein [Candidatus Omnitrophota bacterium]HQO58042.1 hypothetical protein [Candidatus Omnitrophota bacterium]HQP11298.1 hypothetical protein [Candidatus Omnitrophota bacterium]